MGKRWQRLKHLDEAEYWEEICQMNEAQLRIEHKVIQQNVPSAGAGAGATATSGFFAFGRTKGTTAVNGGQINVNSRQTEMIERRLKEMGWAGHGQRKDSVLSTEPTVAANPPVAVDGALSGQAASHAKSTAASHAAQATVQRTTQSATQHAAANLAPYSSADSVAEPTSTFFHSALQGPESEMFTASRGALGHAGAQYCSPIPVDLATAQAQVLGTAPNSGVFVEGGKEFANRRVLHSTKSSIPTALDVQDKKNGNAVVVTETEVNETEVNVNFSQAHTRAAKLLLDTFYRSLSMYDRDGIPKGDIDQVNTCIDEDCGCEDYNDTLQSRAATTSPSEPHECFCGHSWDEHEEQGKNRWILQKFSEMWYPKFEHCQPDGRLKTKMSSIDACLGADCSCGDYDHDSGRSSTVDHKICQCGHGWLVHRRTASSDEQKLAWIVGQVSAAYVEFLIDL